MNMLHGQSLRLNTEYISLLSNGLLSKEPVKLLDHFDQVVSYSDMTNYLSEEKKLYPVFGIDWFHSRVLIERPQELVWLDMRFFILSRKSPMRDRSRTPEHPKGKYIYEGDIVQFPILLRGNDGKTRETIVKS